MRQLSLIQTDVTLRLKRCKHLVKKLQDLRKLMDLSIAQRVGAYSGEFDEPSRM